jgi:hypothetical protein
VAEEGLVFVICQNCHSEVAEDALIICDVCSMECCELCSDGPVCEDCHFGPYDGDFYDIAEIDDDILDPEDL